MQKFSHLDFINRIGLLLIALSLAVPLALAPRTQQVQAANDATIYISPASSSLQNGSNKTFTIYVNTGSNSINAVQAQVSYDTSKFTYISLSPNTTNFPFVAEQSHSNGVITIASGTTSTVTGTKSVGTFTLKAKVGSGTGAISVNINESAAVYNGTDYLASVSGATVTFTTPSSGGGGGDDGGGGGGGDDSGGGSDTGGDDNTGGDSGNDDSEGGDDNSSIQDDKPEIISEEVSNIGFNTAVVNVTSDKNVSALVEYGVGQELGMSVTSSKRAKSHGMVLGEDSQGLLKPGTTYFYRSKLTDADGNQVTGEMKTFRTRGYTVSVLALNKDGQPLEELDLTLNSETLYATTDEQGFALFTDVPPGTHTLAALVDGELFEEEIIVADSLNSFESIIPATTQAPQQDFTINTPFAAANTSLPIAWITGILFAVVLAVLAFIWLPKLRAGGFSIGSSDSKTPKASPSTPTVQPTTPPETGYHTGDVIDPQGTDKPAT